MNGVSPRSGVKVARITPPFVGVRRRHNHPPQKVRGFARGGRVDVDRPLNIRDQNVLLSIQGRPQATGGEQQHDGAHVACS
jgi:hypothetical protein